MTQLHAVPLLWSPQGTRIANETRSRVRFARCPRSIRGGLRRKFHTADREVAPLQEIGKIRLLPGSGRAIARPSSIERIDIERAVPAFSGAAKEPRRPAQEEVAPRRYV